jgi:hypothetical protein
MRLDVPQLHELTEFSGNLQNDTFSMHIRALGRRGHLLSPLLGFLS